jgi:hypothetical protein
LDFAVDGDPGRYSLANIYGNFNASNINDCHTRRGYTGLSGPV